MELYIEKGQEPSKTDIRLGKTRHLMHDKHLHDLFQVLSQSQMHPFLVNEVL